MMSSPHFSILIFLTSFALNGAASEIRTPPATTVARIPVPLHDGSPSPPPPPIEKPDFQIEATQIKEIEVVESPPMPGLPPVEGVMTLTVHQVENPGLPDPPPPPVVEDTPDRHPALQDTAARLRKTRVAFVSATVHEGPRTRLTVHPNGGRDMAVTVWSNVDFNHFCGFGGFEAQDGDGHPRRYALMLGVVNENLALRRKWHAERGIEFEEPEIPNIPEGTPAFVVETENPDPDTLTLIHDLHALYRHEGTRMAEAQVARKQADDARRAYLLANPPKPKDVTIQFWNRQP